MIGHFRRKFPGQEGFWAPETRVSCFRRLIASGAVLSFSFSGTAASTGVKDGTQAMNVARARVEYLKRTDCYRANPPALLGKTLEGEETTPWEERRQSHQKGKIPRSQYASSQVR